MEERKRQKNERSQIIYGRCKVLAEIVNNLKTIYKNEDKNQRAFIETIIGAAIWYIPKPNNCWTGNMSIEAIKSFLNNRNGKSKISEEHDIPRKCAAKELLETNQLLTAEYVEMEYLEKYCKLHYITPEENRRAIKFQKTDVYKNSKEVYKKANIKLIKISNEQLKHIKQGDEEIINQILCKL